MTVGRHIYVTKNGYQNNRGTKTWDLEKFDIGE